MTGGDDSLLLCCRVISVWPKVCSFLTVESTEKPVASRSSCVSACLLATALRPPHRYIAAEGDKQATFTGAEQRAGVFVLAYAVAGIFGRGRPRPANAAVVNSGGAEGGSGQPKAARKRASKGGSTRGKKPARGKKAAARNGEPSKGAGLFGAADEDDDEALPEGFKFDWTAYRAAFGDTPIEDAVTIMFAEYASLYARIAGWTTSAAPAPMTMEEGDSIQQQANNFIINIMTPILGYVHTSKVHKLLRHLLESIRYHGNLRHGNTSSNEAAHKLDKQFYRRTNMAIDTFTGQLVRQAQGAREVGRRNDVADAHSLRTCALVPLLQDRRGGTAGGGGCAAPADGNGGPSVRNGGRVRRGDDSVGTVGSRGGAGAAVGGTHTVGVDARRDVGGVDSVGGDAGPEFGGQPSVGASGGGGARGGTGAVGGAAATRVGTPVEDGGGIEPGSVVGGAADAATAAATKPRRRSPDYLKRHTLGALALRPGLSPLPALFGLPPKHKVPVLSTVEFTATFDCGTTSKQLLRASPHFRDGTAWYDTILFSVDDEVGKDHGGAAAAPTGPWAGGVTEAPIGVGADGRCGNDGGRSASGDEEALHVGEVRAIIRCKEDDFAIVCEMDPVPAEPGCPFEARYCTRLKWRVSDRGGGGIRGVPLSNVRRLLDVVPDFKDLATRKGLQAAPAAYGASQADRFAMRYFSNEFFPWK